MAMTADPSAGWFIDPTATVRIELPGNQWIEVKKELSLEDEATLGSSMMGAFKTGATKKGAEKGSADASVEVDMRKFQITRFITWIVDWSATDKNGKSIPVTKDTVANLKSSITAVIDAAIDAHIEAQNEIEEKKGKTGETSG